MKSLFDQSPETWGKLQEAGFESLAEMARRFTSGVDMDHAMGYTGATSKWHTGVNHPTRHSEKCAALWLKVDDLKKSAQLDLLEQPAPAAPSVPDQHPAPQSAAETLLVFCPADKLAKVSKVLAMMGCEVTEV